MDFSLYNETSFTEKFSTLDFLSRMCQLELRTERTCRQIQGFYCSSDPSLYFCSHQSDAFFSLQIKTQKNIQTEVNHRITSRWNNCLNCSSTSSVRAMWSAGSPATHSSHWSHQTQQQVGGKAEASLARNDWAFKIKCNGNFFNKNETLKSGAEYTWWLLHPITAQV